MYDKIKTVAQAFKARKIDFKKIPKLSGIPDKYRKGMLALFQLQVVAEAVNNDDPKIPDWEADYNNTNQHKWFPWYKGGAPKTASGFSFHVTYYSYWTANYGGGARLVVKDEARAEHMNKYFSELYKELYIVVD